MNDDRDFYKDETDDNKITVGYCAYCKDEVVEGEDMVRYRAALYHRDCFLQSQLNTNGEFIDPNEES